MPVKRIIFVLREDECWWPNKPLPPPLQKKWDTLKHSKNGIANPNRIDKWAKELWTKYQTASDIDMAPASAKTRYQRSKYQRVQLYPPTGWLDADWDGQVPRS